MFSPAAIVRPTLFVTTTLVQAFAEVPMLPEDARLREAAHALLRLERDIFVLWCRWLFQPLDEAGEARARENFAKAMTMVDGALEKVGGGGPFFLGAQVCDAMRPC
jgi:glutathione S-transferase